MWLETLHFQTGVADSERQLLGMLLETLASAQSEEAQAAASASHLKAAPLVQAILTALAPDPLTLPLQVQLAVSTLSWTELAERLLGWAVMPTR